MQILQRAHNMAVRFRVLFRGVGCWEGTPRLKDIAGSAKMFHRLASLIPFRGVGDLREGSLLAITALRALRVSPGRLLPGSKNVATKWLCNW